MGIEAWGSIGYSHFYTPPALAGGFSKAIGGFGYDAGAGLRIRIFHKLAIAFGFQFSGRGYDIDFPAYAEVDTGMTPNNGLAILDVEVSEKADITYVGFYIKPIIELSPKFHLAVLFHPAWQLTYKGESTVSVVGGPSNQIGAAYTLVDESSMEIIPKQFELGIEFAYKWILAPQLILKPHIGINLATSGIFHTGAELSTPFGPWEQNPSFMTLRFGVIFETGLWMDELKE